MERLWQDFRFALRMLLKNPGFTMRTGSGRISAEGEPTGEWNLHAASGSVIVRLPSQAAFDLNAHTSSGRISIDHPLTLRGAVGRKGLRGKVRGGGPLVDLRTSSGSIQTK